VLLHVDCGLLALELDPEWETNHFVYFGHCAAGYVTRITRIAFDGGNYREAASTSSVVIDIPMPEGTGPSMNHNIGTIGFEPDGTLWALIGDKGTEEGQNPDRFTASLIRIVPDRTPTGSGYVPAEGNAFPEGEGLPELYAKGLRYGWRATRDSLGRFFVGDVGGSAHEEVNLVTAPGQFFGWRLCEGPCAEPMPEQTEPLVSWPHVEDGHPYIEDDPEALATTRHVAWVGLQYGASPDRYDGMLTDRIVFGDMCLGWIRMLRVDAAGELVEDVPIAHLAHVTDWVPGPDGYVYTTTFGSCNASSTFEPAALYRVVLGEPAE
jgi:glucose/arabinose dehydrogenase